MKEDYQLIVDLWRFWKDHANPPSWDDDTGWRKLLDDANRFHAEHDCSNVSRELIQAVVNELQRRGK